MQLPLISALLQFANTMFGTNTVVGTNNFYGLAISSFYANGQCRNADGWDAMVSAAKNNGYKRFRIYGNDCETTYDYAIASAKKFGLPVLVGVWVDGTIASSTPKINHDVDMFVAAIKKYGTDYIDGLTVGNEVGDSPINIMNKVWDVRGYLHGVIGYQGPVSTVDSWYQVMNNPVLCDADRVTINAHPFYDGNVQASGAGNFIRDVVLPNIKRACSPYAAVNNIVITESGWPSRGPNHGAAVPSVQNEQAALSSLNCIAKTNKIMAFEAEDSYWKGGSDNERSFGIFYKNLDSSASTC